MPTLNVDNLNVIVAILGAYMILYGVISVKIKQAWYLGEALPAVLMGVLLGPISAKFIDAEEWGVGAEHQKEAITLGLARIVICIQLVIAGYQLPQKYVWKHLKEILLCLIPIMTLMWLCTMACVYLMIPKLTLLSAMVIGACATPTDPVLSQAIAKGPFADKYVNRNLREIISGEAGANDGFAFPFIMLPLYLIRHADIPGAGQELAKRAGEEVGRQGGGIPKALEQWFVETWFYIVLLGVAYGAVVGFSSCHVLKFCLRKKWIDNESFLLWPVAMGLFLVGTAGSLGTNDILASFIAGQMLNWNGVFLEEAEKRHDEVNSSVDVLLNVGGFMYIGAVLPWSEFHRPDVTGITYPRLVALGFLILFLRRLPAILLLYKAMKKVCVSWKEALFMGYYGPIGIGAVFYVEHTRHLIPELGEGDEEHTNLLQALVPTIYWLVLFSIVVHGLSIPIHNLVYKAMGVNEIVDNSGPADVLRLSNTMSLPKNSSVDPKRRNSVTVYNRFSRSNMGGPDSDFTMDRPGGENYELPQTTNRPQTIQFWDNSNRV